MDILIYILYRLLEIYEFIILARCIMSFFGYSGIYAFLCKITDPVINPVRNLLWKTPLGDLPLDFSPVVVMLLIGVIERCLVYLSRML